MNVDGLELARLQRLPPCEPDATQDGIAVDPTGNLYFAGPPRGLYFGGSFGVINACTTQDLTNQTTATAVDAKNGSPVGTCPTSVAGGSIVGFNSGPFSFFGTTVVPGVFGSIDFTNVTGTVAPTQALSAGANANEISKFTDNRIIMIGARLGLPGFLPAIPGTTPFVESGVAFTFKRMTWTCAGVCTAAGISPFTASQNLNLTSPFIGAGITQPVNLVGLPAFLTLQADFILPSENKSVTFGNPATASQSFFVKQSEVVVKGSVTMTT